MEKISDKSDESSSEYVDNIMLTAPIAHVAILQSRKFAQGNPVIAFPLANMIKVTSE